MSDSVIGKGVIELVADARQLRAGIDDAKKSIRTLGEGQKDISKKAAQSIDQYIGKLKAQNAMLGKSTREQELYKLALRGASNEQIKAAETVLKLNEAYKKGAVIGDRIRTGLIAGAAAATLAGGAIAGFIISSINAADKLNDLSKSTGVSVENLSGLALAAKQSGTDLDGVAASISKLSQNIGKDGEKFRALGITAKDPIEAFKQLADVFSAIDDPQTRAALGAAALGKSWASAAPLLSEGGKNIGEMVEKGKKLSGVTQQMAEDADKFNDQLEELKASAGGLGTKLAGEMLPAFNDITKAVKLAYEESGKLQALWVAMGSLGAFLFTDEFSSATVKIKNLQGEINSLEDNKKRLVGGGYLDKFLFGDNAQIDAKIGNLKSQIAGLQESVKPKAPPTVSPSEAARIAKEKADKEAKAKRFINVPSKTGKGATSEYDASIKASAQYIESLKQEASQIGLNSDQIKMMSVAREAAKAPTAALRMEIMQLALANDIATKAQQAKTEAEKVTADAIEKAKQQTQVTWDQVRALETELETYGFLESEVSAFHLARLQAQRSSLELTESEITALDSQIAAMQRLGQLQGKKETKDVIVEQQKKAAEEGKKIWDDFQENVQSNLGDGLYDAMNGNFKNIGDSFKQLVLRMAADALAADLTKALFGGKGDKSGSGGVGSLISVFSSMFSGSATVAHTGGIIGSDSLPTRSFDSLPRYHTGGIAGNEVPAILERGEGVFTKEQMNNLAPVNGGGGGAINFAPVYNIDARADRAQVQQDMQRISQQSQAQLVDKLQRAGKL